MPDTALPTVPSLSNPEAAQWNKTLMREFQAELEKNPEADLLSMIPELYRHDHRVSQYRQISYAAKINLRTVHELLDTLHHEPEINILSALPKNYNRRINMATGPKLLPPTEREVPNQGPDLSSHLDPIETAKIVFPPSDAVTALIAKYPDGSPTGQEKPLATSLKQLLRNSPRLWESPVRGMVVQCSENIVAKVVFGDEDDTTEYTSMQFLAKYAPDIPIPKVHGLIALGPLMVLFMSFIPGLTLAQAWPALSHEEKLSIQQRLDNIFRRLRSLGQDTQGIGGVCGEGAKESRLNDIALFKNISTSQEFSDLQFSAPHHGSDTYVALLRSFLNSDDSSMLRPVFTHGDVRTANIMVQKDPDLGGYAITGIIDWEDSGFYPASQECMSMTQTLSPVKNDDWYLYLPKSISPSEFPIRWLVNKLWSIHLHV